MVERSILALARAAISAITVSLIASSSVGIGAKPANKEKACSTEMDIFTALTEKLTARDDLISDQAPPLPYTFDHPDIISRRLVPFSSDSSVWQAKWSGIKPSYEMSKLAVRANWGRVLSCLHGKSVFAGIAIVTASEANSTLRKWSGTRGGPFINQFTSPVFNEDKSLALVMYRRDGNSGGFEEYDLLSYYHGTWKVISRLPVSSS